MAFCNALSEQEGLTPYYKIRGSAVKLEKESNGYRLPTEAEWEFAARAGTTQTYGAVQESREVCDHGNVANDSNRSSGAMLQIDRFHCEDGFEGLAPVGSFQRNALQLADMTGNVSEWVWDFYDDEPPGGDDPVVNKGKTRVYKGGSWNGDPYSSRVAWRYGMNPESRSYERGFRVARDAP